MKISFETDTAAFDEDYRGEVSRILRKIIKQLEEGYHAGKIYDANGNKVGQWTT